MIIYILELEDNKFYVGKTKNVVKRINEHIEGNGSVWTKKYKVINVERTIITENSFDEDKYTKEYMARYGINNVRGGSYVTLTLTIEQIKLLKREIWTAENKCLKCGHSNHFIKNCFALEDNFGDKIEIKEKFFTLEDKIEIQENKFFTFVKRLFIDF